ncbi:hypothetical protein EAW94_21870 [Salmonella enterica]|nr:hypothetical protein [Salmonella enterica]
MLLQAERLLGGMLFLEVGCRVMEWSLLALYLFLFLLVVLLLVVDWRRYEAQHWEACSFCLWLRRMVRQYVGPCILLVVSLGFMISGLLFCGGPCDR